MDRDIRDLINEQIERSRVLQQATFQAGRQPPPGPVITISRQLGSGGGMVARRLADILGWSFWDKELVDAIAKDAAVSQKIVEDFDEKSISEIERLARTLAGQPDVGGFLYRRHLARTLLAIAKRGNAVVLGRGANHILRKALNIRLVASEGSRVNSLMKYQGISQDEALHRMHESDRERAAYVRTVFDKSIDDPLTYDMTLTTDRFGVDGTADLIIAALKITSGSALQTPTAAER